MADPKISATLDQKNYAPGALMRLTAPYNDPDDRNIQVSFVLHDGSLAGEGTGIGHLIDHVTVTAPPGWQKASDDGKTAVFTCPAPAAGPVSATVTATDEQGNVTTATATATITAPTPAPTPSTPNAFPSLSDGGFLLGDFNTTASAGVDTQPSGDTSAHWLWHRDTHLALVDAQGRKVFNHRSTFAQMPATFPPIAVGDAQSGIKTALRIRPPQISGKFDIAGLLAGHYNANLTAIVMGLAQRGWIIPVHEPEKAIKLGLMTWADWRSATRYVYRFVKNLRPDVQVGVALLTYQWQTGFATTANPDDAFPGSDCCDFIGFDTYLMEFNGGLTSMTASPGFMRCYQWAASKKTASGAPMPLGFTEWGFVHTYEASSDGGKTWTVAKRAFTDDQGAVIIANTWQWALGKLVFGLHWNARRADNDGVHARSMYLNPTVGGDGMPKSLDAMRTVIQQHGVAA